MAKSSGLGAQFLLAGYNIGADVTSLSRIGGGPAALEVTGITKSGIERIGGGRDGAMEIATWFNPSANMSHDRLSTLPTADTMGTYCHRATIGSDAASINAKQVNFDGNRGQDGSFTFAASLTANGYGLEWGTLLTAVTRTDTGATNGSSVDFGTGSTAFGAQFYLHVVAFSGTDITITVQESSDDGAGDSFAAVTGGAFTQVTSGPTWERIQTARGQTVERYLRVATSTTGGFSSCEFVVMAVRNDTSVVF